MHVDKHVSCHFVAMSSVCPPLPQWLKNLVFQIHKAIHTIVHKHGSQGLFLTLDWRLLSKSILPNQPHFCFVLINVMCQVIRWMEYVRVLGSMGSACCSQHNRGLAQDLG